MPSSSDIAQLMVGGFQPEKAEGMNTTLQFDLSGESGGQFYLEVKDGTIEAHQGTSQEAKMTLRASAEDYYAVMTGAINPMQAFMSGKIKISGDMGLAMKMQTIFKAG